MGTRSLIAVFHNGEYKVAQYAQWDGYPSGQGVGVLSFLSKQENIRLLKEKLSKCRFLEFEGRDKKFAEDYNKNSPKYMSDPDNRTAEQKHWFYSYKTRDLGCDILKNIANSNDDEILLINSIDFADDSVFCEWCYVIDLDKNSFEVFEGFNKDQLKKQKDFILVNFKEINLMNVTIL